MIIINQQKCFGFRNIFRTMFSYLKKTQKVVYGIMMLKSSEIFLRHLSGNPENVENYNNNALHLN